jgi:two-component system, NarL family, sensor kinase
MSSRVVVGRLMAAVGSVAAIGGLVWLIVLGLGEALWSEWLVHNGIIAVGSGVIAWTVLSTQPRNAVSWVLASASLLTGVGVGLYAVGAHLAAFHGLDGALFDLTASELPLSLALVLMQVNWLWIGIFLPFTLGLLLFPDGRPPSPRWRWLTRLVLIVLAMTMVGLLLEGRPSTTVTYEETQNMAGGFSSVTASMVTLGYPSIFLLALACVAGLVGRFRRSEGVERQQFRWVTWGASVAGICLVAAMVLDEFGDRVDLSQYLVGLAMAALLSSFGIAIGKYRLYEIDTVISRTFVYGALALFIGVVYVGIVVGLGYLLGFHDEANTWLGVAATVVIATAFQPLRRQLQRVANRVVYGRRATPYEVLSSFSQGMSTVDDEVLARIARSLVEGTTATSASIWARQGARVHCLAAWPRPPDQDRVDSGDPIPGADRIADVVHDDEVLGKVGIGLPPSQPFPPPDARLLDHVASGLGLALRNLLLTEDLQARVEELRNSRRRIVTVQDETRRKLERDLHDGAQQRLVALKIKLGIGVSMAAKSGLGDVGAMLATVRDETDHVIESVRDFARGIYPPLLEAEGLGVALTAQARKLPLPVSVQTAGVGRYSKQQEATVYFCVLEALQNAMKHSGATSVQVALDDRGGGLEFQVRDDGVGFDPAKMTGQGLVNMQDRIAALEGTLTIDSQPGRGTVLAGRIPVEEVVSA